MNSTLYIYGTQCISNANGKHYLTNAQVFFLTVTNSLTLFGNFTTNVLVLFLIVKTKQLKVTHAILFF